MGSEHESDQLNLESKHHRASKTTEGGRCLAPYGPYAQQSCSYRYQAYKQALDECEVYNGDKYASLGGSKKKVVMVRQRKPKRGEKRWEKVKLDAPKDGEWDVSESNTNFQRSCNRPYWYEAHHIIPHSQLKTAVADVGKDKPNGAKLKLTVRRGLLDEGYNLNHKKNMFILPMAGIVAQALGLPRHLASFDHQNHPQYCKYVEGKLQKFFQPVKETGSGHKKKVEYSPVKAKLEKLSKRLRADIKKLGKLWEKQDDVSLEDLNPTDSDVGMASIK